MCAITCPMSRLESPHIISLPEPGGLTASSRTSMSGVAACTQESTYQWWIHSKVAAQIWRMVNMGHSPSHASTIPLVLNPVTGAMKAVYRVVFDDWFSTVSYTAEDLLPDFTSAEWSRNLVILFSSIQVKMMRSPTMAPHVPLSSCPETAQSGTLPTPRCLSPL